MDGGIKRAACGAKPCSACAVRPLARPSARGDIADCRSGAIGVLCACPCTRCGTPPPSASSSSTIRTLECETSEAVIAAAGPNVSGSRQSPLGLRCDGAFMTAMRVVHRCPADTRCGVLSRLRSFVKRRFLSCWCDVAVQGGVLSLLRRKLGSSAADTEAHAARRPVPSKGMDAVGLRLLWSRLLSTPRAIAWPRWPSGLIGVSCAALPFRLCSGMPVGSVRVRRLESKLTVACAF
jgi:hypothetical protein